MCEAVLEKMVESCFEVTEFDGLNRRRECRAVRLGPKGIELLTDVVPSGRFAWLEFNLPDSGYRIKALGEVMAVIGGDGPTRVIMRFKHVFPPDRVAMEHYLSPRLAA